MPKYYIVDQNDLFDYQSGGDKMPSYDESHYEQGISRKENKDGTYSYTYNNNNKEVSNQDLERIKKLRIPGTWKNVWINQDPNYRLQVIGIDPHKKKQYIYTKEHKDKKKDQKYKTLEKLIGLIGKINKILDEHQKLPKFNKNRVLSTMLMIIMMTGIRAGKEFYAKRNDTYGLCSLRKKHITFNDNKNEITIKFKGKKNVFHTHTVLLNDKMYEELKNLSKLYLNKEKKDEDKLFNYVDKGETIKLNEFDLNDYIHDYIDKSIVIKDFRTYLVNYTYIKNLLFFTNEIFKSKDEKTAKKIKEIIKVSIENTADFIQHKPQICKNSYIYDYITEFYKNNVDYFIDNKNNKVFDILKDIINKKG